MNNHFDSLVPGSVERGARLEVRAPYDGRSLGNVALADASAVDCALSTAADRFRDRKGSIPLPRRLEILRTAAGLLKERADAFALAMADEGGKPLVDSRVEVARAVDGLLNAVESMHSNAGEVVPMNVNAASAGRFAFTQREPIGVVVAVSAFNHPLNLIVHQVAPGIAAGCPVIVKPAEATPLTCFRFVELLREAGLSEQWCQALLTESRETTARLVSDPRVAFFSFIGSAAVGWHLRSRLAPGTRCALEHGGAAPVIVAPDADLDSALPRLVKGAFYHAGQVCVSVQRVFVHRSLFDSVAKGLAARAQALRVGDPTSPNTEVGPLIRKTEVERIDRWIGEARTGGTRVICGGERVGETCYRPTVLLEPPPDAKVSTEEVFGPVVCVYAYDELDEAIRRANHPRFAFHAAVFTNDLRTAWRAFEGLEASGVMINDHTAFRVDWMPFAGLKQSGLGVGGIPYTLRDMQIDKMFVGAMS